MIGCLVTGWQVSQYDVLPDIFVCFFIYLWPIIVAYKHRPSLLLLHVTLKKKTSHQKVKHKHTGVAVMFVMYVVMVGLRRATVR